MSSIVEQKGIGGNFSGFLIGFKPEQTSLPELSKNQI
jgi:hypothetical protein